MITSLLLTSIHLFLAIIPGMGWAISLNYRHLYLPSFAISMLLPVLSAFIAKAVGLSFHQALLVWGIIAIIGWSGALTRSMSLKPIHKFFPYIGLSFLWGGYSIFAGPYVDVPADFIFHTRFIEANLEAMANNAFTEAPTLLHKFNYYGHYLWSVELHLLGLEAWHAYEALAYVNALLLFFGIYSGGILIFESTPNTNIVSSALAFIAAIASLFLFSVDAFSFARYYFIAPVIHTFVGFLAAGLIGTNMLRGQGNIVRDSVLIVLIAFWLLLAHRQELLFLLVMLFMVLLIESVKAPKNMVLKALSVTAISLAIVIWAFFYIYVERSPIDDSKVIELQRILPFVKNLYISNPLYQFYQVMGVTGIITLVVLWFLRRDWWQNSWLLAAWLSPFITLFNPLFVDFFLRQASSDVLWRMAFLTQIYYLFVLAIYLLVRRIFSFDHNLIVRAIASVSMMLLILSLIPSEGRFWKFGPNRFLGLSANNAKNIPNYWQDLWYWLDSQQPNIVLTDPFTGYQLASFTAHDYRGYKFFPARGFRPYRFEDYSDSPLEVYDGAWLIMNLRDGGYSEMGATTKHWYADSLTLSKWYPQNLVAHIKENPSHFNLVWQSDDELISIYQINY